VFSLLTADTAAGISLLQSRFANKDALAGRIPKRSTEAVDYKAPGSLPGEHETLIPFKTTRQQKKFSFVLQGRGESEGREAKGTENRGRGSAYL
jgi:hypothetical protein